jgi:hypothetical protein
LPFIATLAMRDSLERLDDLIDVRIRSAMRTDPAEALSREACLAMESSRLDRTLDVAFDSLSVPTSRARAIFIDTLRAHCVEDARPAIYAFLIGHGTDVRSVLADDAVLSASDRLEVLSLFAAKVDQEGRRRRISFTPDPHAAFKRMLTDWTRYVSHPRHLVHALARTLGTDSRCEDILASLPPHAVPPEVKYWLGRRSAVGPVEIRAREIATGLYECARCGSRELAAAKVTRSGTEGFEQDSVETMFDCSACGTSHYAVWEIGASRSSNGTPMAWVNERL